jgi:hypothetical protein
MAVLHKRSRKALLYKIVQYQTAYVNTVQSYIDFAEYCQKIQAARKQCVPNINTLNMKKQRQWIYIFWLTWLRHRVDRCPIAR